MSEQTLTYPAGCSVHVGRVGSASAASLLGGTGGRKTQAGPSEGACSELFMETALSEDDDRLLMSQRSHQYLLWSP